MNHRLWLESFPSKGIPAWPCPRCIAGHLRLRDALWVSVETAESILAQQHDEFEPDWLSERASAVLECSVCLDPVMLSATGSWVRVEDPGSEDYGSFVLEYWPSCLLPALPIVRVPEATPVPVKRALDLSFATYWSSPGASAMHIRQSVERLLDALAIPRETVPAARTPKPCAGCGVVPEASKESQSPKPLSLHARLDQLLSQTDPAMAKRLMAIKWIGNDGAHDQFVSHKDVVSAYEILLFVLNGLYDKTPAHIDALVDGVLAKKKRSPK